jgi:hypothetical protein
VTREEQGGHDAKHKDEKTKHKNGNLKKHKDGKTKHKDTKREIHKYIYKGAYKRPEKYVPKNKTRIKQEK